MGAAVGDYDNDGDSDLYVTGYGRNYLFRNRVTESSRKWRNKPACVTQGWSTSAAWFDYNKDGKLDLYEATTCSGHLKRPVSFFGWTDRAIVHRQCIRPSRAASTVIWEEDALSMSPYGRNFDFTAIPI
jgi:hypothetical protein